MASLKILFLAIAVFLPHGNQGGIAGILMSEAKTKSAQTVAKPQCDYVPEERTYKCKNIVNKFPDVFYGHYHLKCVECLLPNFSKESFPYNNDLLSLNLSSSSMRTIAPNAFAAFPGVRDIILSYNRLRTIEVDAFNGLRQVFELHLEYNELRQLKKGFLNGFEGSALYLSHNHLEEVPTDVFAGTYGLMNLDLSYNRIATLHADSFANLKGLEYLHLEGNQLCALPFGVFRHLPLLKDLNLANNKFRKIHTGAFSGLMNLFALNLTGNPLIEVSSSMIASLDELTVLDVSATTIDYLDVMEIQANAPNLQRIGLADNTWSCRVLQNIIRMLRSHNIKVFEHDRYEVTNIKGIACLDNLITEERIPFDVFYKLVAQQSKELNTSC